MIELEIRNKVHQCRSEYSEITLEELDWIVNKLDEVNSFDSWAAILSKLSDIPQDEIEEWSVKDFKKVISHILHISELTGDKPKKVLVVEDRVYHFIPNKNLTGRKLVQLQTAYAKNEKLIAIICALFDGKSDDDQKKRDLSSLPSSNFVEHLIWTTLDLVSKIHKVSQKNEVKTTN